MTKENILFIVEGKTEGCPTIWGKGLWNILKAEKDWMRKGRIFHDIEVFNGKYDMKDTMKFTVRQHLSPPKKTVTKAKVKPLGDYVFILRDLDCEDKKKIEDEIDNELSDYKGRYSIHFCHTGN
ncbi:MAG: hypothetical protein HQL03_09720 [Nitrospirae bacterium]|nr:hypothetical protein [Nitrospirota bacterium]